MQRPQVQALVSADAGPAGCFHLRYHTCMGARVSARVHPAEEGLLPDSTGSVAAAGHRVPSTRRQDRARLLGGTGRAQLLGRQLGCHGEEGA